MADQFNIANEKFDTLQGTISVYSNKQKTVLQISATTLATLLTLATSWINFWGISKDKKNATAVDRANTKAIKVKYIAFLRLFVKQNYYDNPLATDIDVLAAGLKVHATGHTVNKVASSEVPAVKLTPLKGDLMDVNCLNSSGTIGKPDKIVFIRVKWVIGAVVPANPKLYTLFQDFTKHPIQIQFDAEDAGKPLAIIVCYVNSNGAESTYCPVINTIVP